MWIKRRNIRNVANRTPNYWWLNHHFLYTHFLCSAPVKHKMTFEISLYTYIRLRSTESATASLYLIHLISYSQRKGMYGESQSTGKSLMVLRGATTHSAHQQRSLFAIRCINSLRTAHRAKRVDWAEKKTQVDLDENVFVVVDKYYSYLKKNMIKVYH